MKKAIKKEIYAEIICEHKSTFEQYEPSIYICSHCQKGVERYHNFCPNCGAKFNKDTDND